MYITLLINQGGSHRIVQEFFWVQACMNSGSGFCRPGMSIFRFSAEFRLFFLLSAFLKMIFRFFWKIKKNFFLFRLPIPPLHTIRRALVNSRWRLGLPVWASSISGQCLKVPYLHSALMLAYSATRRGRWWFSGGMEDGLEVMARVLPIELQHLHPLPFHPHHFSLSLSHTHTHTHTHSGLPAATISLYHATISPCMLYSCQIGYSHLQKINPIFFSHPETS